MIRIGTSGWSYNHWFGRFYPKELAKNKAFSFYQSRFDTVEVNVSFYRLLPEKTYMKWHDEAKEDFILAIKGSRFITHIKRLKNCDDARERFFGPLRELKEKTGPILFQLPSNYQKDLPVLESFIKDLPMDYRYAFEFRHKSWSDNDTLALLQEKNIAFVISHSSSFPCIKKVTSDLVYIRLHGLGALYSAMYSEEQLKGWAEKINDWNSRKLDVFVYFNNDNKAYAPINALRLKELILQGARRETRKHV